MATPLTPNLSDSIDPVNQMVLKLNSNRIKSPGQEKFDE